MKTNRSCAVKVSGLLFSTLTVISFSLTLSPASAHAQGGVPLWTNRYNGSANDYAFAIAADANGNVFVTGSSFATTTNEFSDFMTIKYTGAGVLLWTRRYKAGNGSSSAKAIAVDKNGNVFVTGSSLNGQLYTTSDYAVIAYSGLGVSLWTNHYNGPGNGEDYPVGIAVDSTGRVFLTGYSWDGINKDYATLAYSNAGVPLWTNRYNGPGNGVDSAFGIVVDSSDNVFVTGRSWNGSNSDYTTLAYSNTGVPLWTNRYGAGSGEFGGIALDSNGNVFVTGSLWNGTNLYDYATIAYSSSGLTLWTNHYNGPATANSYDVAHAIVVDASGNAFVTGSSYDTSGQTTEYATIRYSSTGVPGWTNRYASGIPVAIGVDSSGNVFVTGNSATIGYSSAGVPLWTNLHVSSPQAIALDGSGNVFLTGYSSNGSDNDFLTIKYSSSIPPPRLDFQMVNNQLVLSWTNVGFNLQSAPTITDTFTNIPGTTSPYTNFLTGAQRFFRLVQ
jgi:hypothetical protein